MLRQVPNRNPLQERMEYKSRIRASMGEEEYRFLASKSAPALHRVQESAIVVTEAQVYQMYLKIPWATELEQEVLERTYQMAREAPLKMDGP